MTSPKDELLREARARLAEHGHGHAQRMPGCKSCDTVARIDDCLSAPSAPVEGDKCDTCHGTGRMYVGNSGSAEDGNAPEFEQCPMCGYGDPTDAEECEIRAAMSLHHGDAVVRATGDFFRRLCRTALRFYEPGYTPTDLYLASLSAQQRWVAVSNRVPDHDGDVLAWHPVMQWGPLIRSARTVRMWAQDPNDTSMRDGYWMPLPSAPPAPGVLGEGKEP